MLPTSHRLRNSRDFKRVYGRGRSYVHPLLVLYVQAAAEDTKRIGISVSKKVGGAVERNRVKRRIREAMRELIGRLAPGFDAILVARPALKSAELPVIELALRDVFGRAGRLDGRRSSARARCEGSASD